MKEYIYYIVTVTSSFDNAEIVKLVYSNMSVALKIAASYEANLYMVKIEKIRAKILAVVAVPLQGDVKP
jgi:hypothetical protein